PRLGRRGGGGEPRRRPRGRLWTHGRGPTAVGHAHRLPGRAAGVAGAGRLLRPHRARRVGPAPHSGQRPDPAGGGAAPARRDRHPATAGAGPLRPAALPARAGRRQRRRRTHRPGRPGRALLAAATGRHPARRALLLLTHAALTRSSSADRSSGADPVVQRALRVVRRALPVTARPGRGRKVRPGVTMVPTGPVGSAVPLLGKRGGKPQLRGVTRMKAMVYHGPGRRSWEEVPEPVIVDDTDAIVRVDTVTICGTDLHILKGDVPAVTDGRILGHEAVGTVTEVGSAVKNVAVGDRVLVSCISACGRCRYCRESAYGQCVHGGGWILGHLIDGTQAEMVRVPFADNSTYPIPDGVSDEQVLMLADILPTGYEVGTINGQVAPGDTVAVVGAGPIGLATILGTRLLSPSHVIAIDLRSEEHTSELQS